MNYIIINNIYLRKEKMIMSKEKIIIDTVVGITDGLLGSEKVQKFLCGKYSDGTPRSLPDALNDKLYSPEQKKNKKKNDKKKKKKKHGKKKKKYDMTFEF
jgi:translation elongation factor EF-G